MLDIDYSVLRKIYQLGQIKVGSLAKELGVPHRLAEQDRASHHSFL